MEKQEQLFSTKDIFYVDKIKSPNDWIFQYISLGEKYVLWQKFYNLYSNKQKIEIGKNIFNAAFLVKNALNSEFYECEQKHKILLDYFYALLKSYIKSADIIITNQQYVAQIAASLNLPILWIEKEQNQQLMSDNIKKCKKILYERGAEPQSAEDEFIKANPLPEADF